MTLNRLMLSPCSLCCGTWRQFDHAFKSKITPFFAAIFFQIFHLWSQTIPKNRIKFHHSTLFAASKYSHPWSPSFYAPSPSALWTSACCRTWKTIDLGNWKWGVSLAGFPTNKFFKFTGWRIWSFFWSCIILLNATNWLSQKNCWMEYTVTHQEINQEQISRLLDLKK